MLVATTILVVQGVLTVPARPPSVASVVALIALGSLFTALTLLLFYGLIARASPVWATPAFYLSPAATVGWVFLGERATWSTIAGLVVIVGGSALAATGHAPDRRLKTGTADVSGSDGNT